MWPRAILFLTTWLLAPHIAGANEPRIVVDGENLILAGRVKRIVAYGPPGFGEDPATDRREDYFTLQLESPLRGRSSEGDLDNDTTSTVQLFYIGNWPPNLRDSLNEALKSQRLVTVRGTAMLAQNGHHHETILVSVRTLSAH